MDKLHIRFDHAVAESAFDKAAADGIAQRVVRASKRRQNAPPLIGREAELLATLRTAEAAHAQALADLRRERAEAQVAMTARRGRRPGVSQSGSGLHLAPLRAFTAILKAFWEPATGTRFGYEVERRTGAPDGRAPRSAATRLVWEAVQYLDQDYTLANVGTVMRALQRGSHRWSP